METEKGGVEEEDAQDEEEPAHPPFRSVSYLLLHSPSNY